jgi:regulator of sigma E protease
MTWIFQNIIPFLVILTVLVFVHELGHYLVARWHGVKVEIFSIGFGKELFGWTDKVGTRWKFCLIPLGGYVKMFGDTNAASTPDPHIEKLTSAQKKKAFYAKTVGQRAQIVFAGPLANFIYAILVFAVIFMFYGQAVTPPVIGAVQDDSPASRADLRIGDRIIEAEGTSIERFEDLQQIVRLRPGETITLVVLRDGTEIFKELTTGIKSFDTGFGREDKIGFVGLVATGLEYKKYGPIQSIWQGTRETYTIVQTMFVAIGQMINGDRGTEQIGGPIQIAQISGLAAKAGLYALLWFSALLSINLGLINLFPIPVLDGGHLFFYLIEFIKGKPISPKVLGYFSRIGFALLIFLMIYALWNDLTGLFLPH